MKATKAPDIFDHKLRALRVLRGEIYIFFFVAAQPPRKTSDARESSLTEGRSRSRFLIPSPKLADVPAASEGRWSGTIRCRARAAP